MSEDNLMTLVREKVVPKSFLGIQNFINQINSLSAEEVQALVDLRKHKVDGLQIQHENAIDPQFC